MVSAARGVTDKLLRVAKGDLDSLREIEDIHHNLVKNIDDPQARLLPEIEKLLGRLRGIAKALSMLGEDTPAARDLVVAHGEMLSARIMAAALRSIGVPGVAVDAPELGVVTDTKFGEASPITPLAKSLVKPKLASMLAEDLVPVVTGFIGRSLDGRLTTLGRGGSDYTATLLASIIEAREVQLVTDVPGVLSGDPCLVDNPVLVGEMSYQEAMDLAMVGGKKFHPKTFEPVMEAGIPVRITGLEGGQGTIVSPKGSGAPVKAVATGSSLSLLYVKGGGMVGRRGTAGEITTRIAGAGANIVAIAQPASETSISFLLPEKSSNAVVEELSDPELAGVVHGVDVLESAHVSVVGYRVGDPEILSKLASRLPRQPHMISYSGASTAITFALPPPDALEFMRKVHDEVVLPCLTR